MQKYYWPMLIASTLIVSMMLFDMHAPINNNQRTVKELFQQWKIKFHKKYYSNSQENYRYSLFYENYLFVQENTKKYQNGQTITQVALNQFSDLLQEEVVKMFLSDYVPNNLLRKSIDDFACNGPQAPQAKLEVNFTLDINMLNPRVGVQGQCASGYAFATIGAVQAHMYKFKKNFTSLSVQQMVDCTQSTGNNGCSGGNSLNTLQFLLNRGVMKQSDYPYVGKTQTCSYSPAKKVWDIANCTRLNTTTVQGLQKAIMQLPIIVQFDANDKNFIQLSGDGLYLNNDKACGSKINHYMLAVGWGQFDKKAPLGTQTYFYILVKNSLGSSWGDKGYGKIVYKSHQPAESDKENQGCGIFKQSYFPWG